MKIKLSTVIKDRTGKDIERDGKPLMFRTMAQDALDAVFSSENISGSEKAKRFTLLMKLNDEDPDLTVEDLAMMKDSIGKAFGPMGVGRCYEIIEAATA